MPEPVLDLDSAERIAQRDLARLVGADQVPLEYVVLQLLSLAVDVCSLTPMLFAEITLFCTVAFSTA